MIFGAAPGCKDGQKTPDSELHQGDPDGRAAPEKLPLTDVQLEALRAKWAERLDAEPNYPNTDAFAVARAELTRVSNEATDVHLRANAALLLGALHELRGEREPAIGFYRHASKLVMSAPGERIADDAGPFMALALALAADKQYPDAIEAQKEATTLDPDNLENWLALAELFVRAGDEESATKAYVDYEVRRKGLIDGLTLKKGDDYRVDVATRIGCAQALASASDAGTAVALLYALKTDPDAKVREAVASAMGVQRLSMYAEPLTQFATAEKDATVREAIAWAQKEIARDPVQARPVAAAPKEGDGEAPDAVKPPEPHG